MKWYAKTELFSIFLVCAFPLHLWTLIQALWDFSRLAARTSAWDAIGVASYGLVFTFLRTLIIFLIVLLLGLLVLRTWGSERRLAIIGGSFLLVSLFAIIGQLIFQLPIHIPVSDQMLEIFANQTRPLRVLYLVTLAVIGPMVALFVYGMLWSEKFVRFINELIDKLSVLTFFYLFLDVVGLVIVVIRNI